MGVLVRVGRAKVRRSRRWESCPGRGRRGRGQPSPPTGHAVFRRRNCRDSQRNCQRAGRFRSGSPKARSTFWLTA